MRMFAALDVGCKRTAVRVIDERGGIIWRGVVDTHPGALASALRRWHGALAKVGLESGTMSHGWRGHCAAWAMRWCAWMRGERQMP